MQNNKIKIAYIQEANPKDRKSSSGVPYKMYEQLINHGYQVQWFPVTYTKLFSIYAFFCKLTQKITRKQINFYHTKIGAKIISKSVTRNQKEINTCDLIYAPLGSSAIYSLKTNKPIIYESDATWNSMVNYYFFNLSKRCIKQANEVEQHALDKSKKILFASNWAADSAINFYNQNPQKVHVIEYGPNIDIDNLNEKQYFYNGTLNILFLGVEWNRKGGEIAVEAVQKLNSYGIKSVIHIVGINHQEFPKKYLNIPYINYIGFLNKNIPEDYNKLTNLIANCHLLLLPTIAECAGIAFCEASAYGLPIFTHLTGGTGNYIKNGINGYLLPLGSTGIDFADKIKECFNNGELESMAKSSQQLFKSLLNWDRWGDEFEKLINSIFEYC